jgi:prepilin peptidase CpaA
MTILIPVLLIIMPALTIIAGLRDLTTMTIPNWISAAIIVAFFPAALAVGLPWLSILTHVGVAFGALLAGMGMFALRWIGGGDAKLMAATTLWLGLTSSLTFVLWTAVIGGLFGLLLLMTRRHVEPFMAWAPRWLARLMEPKGDIPYGVAIAAGALIAYPASPMVVALLTR